MLHAFGFWFWHIATIIMNMSLSLRSFITGVVQCTYIQLMESLKYAAFHVTHNKLQNINLIFFYSSESFRASEDYYDHMFVWGSYWDADLLYFDINGMFYIKYKRANRIYIFLYKCFCQVHQCFDYCRHRYDEHQVCKSCLVKR